MAVRPKVKPGQGKEVGAGCGGGERRGRERPVLQSSSATCQCPGRNMLRSACIVVFSLLFFCSIRSFQVFLQQCLLRLSLTKVTLKKQAVELLVSKRFQ